MPFPLGLHSQGRENLGTIHWNEPTFYRVNGKDPEIFHGGAAPLESSKKVEYMRQAFFSEPHF